MFATLLPSAFPRAIPGRPSAAARVVTTSSGSEVPQATMVKPIIIGEIPSRRAMLTPPSTSQSAPFTSKMRPKARATPGGRSANMQAS